MKKKRFQCGACGSRLKGIFCNLSDSNLEALELSKSSHSYKRGQVIFYEGNPPFAVYCILSGRVKLYKAGRKEKDEIIKLAGEGEIIGYRSSLTGESYPETAEAIESSVVCTVPNDLFLRFLHDSPAISLQLIRQMAFDLSRLERQMLVRSQESVRQRTARALLALFESDDKPSIDSSVLTVPLSRGEIAQIVGTTPETLSRTLHLFAGRGVIDITRRSIRLKSIAALKSVASGLPSGS